MRPIPAARVGYGHGILRALDERGKLRLDEFVTEFSEEQLFPPEAESEAGRTRQYVALLRAAALIEEDRGSVALTDLGKRYAKAGDKRDVFVVSPGQAEWLRRQLREKHLTESIWNGAAIGLSLYATLGPDDYVALADFGRAAAHLGRAGWDNENTFRLQGERFTHLLEDMELIGPDRRLTETGTETKADLRLPHHMSLKELARSLNPGADEAAEAEKESLVPEPPPPPPPEPEPAAPEPAAPEPAAPEPATPEPAPAADAPGPIEAAIAAATPEPTAPEAPPETAAPDAATAPATPAVEPPPKDFTAMKPTQAITALKPEDIAAWQAQQKQVPKAAGGPFLTLEGVRDAATRRGLLLDDGVYAAAVAALASGRHLVLTGGTGSGKTTLALAIAEAAVRQDRCPSILCTTGRAGTGRVPQAIRAGQWLLIDELDRVRLDRALGRVSTVLAGQAIDTPEGELTPPPDWRVIATMGDISGVGQTSPALRRRFVFVEVPVLTREQLEQLVDRWADGDAQAAAIGRRLVAINDVVELGPGLYADAIAYVRARRTLAPADETSLMLEALAGFVLPQLEGMGDEVAGEAVRAAGM